MLNITLSTLPFPAALSHYTILMHVQLPNTGLLQHYILPALLADPGIFAGLIESRPGLHLLRREGQKQRHLSRKTATPPNASQQMHALDLKPAA